MEYGFIGLTGGEFKEQTGKQGYILRNSENGNERLEAGLSLKNTWTEPKSYAKTWKQ